MSITKTARFLCYLALLFGRFPAEAQNYFTDADVDAAKRFLHDSFSPTNVNTCMVIGLVDERGSKVFTAGKLDNGTGQGANSNTVFQIASITKTFTALLLVDMVERGEMKLDDPVAEYLPESVKVPARNGKQYSLLVTDSGSNDVAVIFINPDKPAWSLFTMIPVGNGPRQMAIKAFTATQKRK